MRRLSLFGLALLIATPALEPVGCDKFKWPLDKERAMLAAATPAPSGGEIGQPLTSACRLTLAAADAAKLPNPPTRAPKPGTFSGFVTVQAPPKAGTYRITLSEGAWIDVFQDGKEIKSGAFSGAQGCDGVRKSVKFDLAATPFIIELNGTAKDSIAFVLTPD